MVAILSWEYELRYALYEVTLWDLIMSVWFDSNVITFYQMNGYTSEWLALKEV